jgi:Xaa-Pro dipeptidase
MMRTLPIGAPLALHREMHAVAEDALLAVEDSLRPGRTFGEAFDAHGRVMDAAGYQAHRLNACGYSLGTTFAPNWMDWPMLYHANPVGIEPGMVIFCHMILFNSDQGVAMTLGRTSLVTEDGPEPLSKADLALVSR